MSLNKIFALATAAALVDAQGCCSKPCATNPTRSCCGTCPPACTTAPGQMEAPTMDSKCKKTTIHWTVPESCSPITQMELRCKDKHGHYHSMPSIVGTYNSWTVDNKHFQKAPYNLDLETDELVCHIRNYSKFGKSPFSPDSKATPFGECEKAKVLSDEKKPKKCEWSCRQNGCGGLCNGIWWADTRSYWGNIYAQAKEKVTPSCCSIPKLAKYCGCETPEKTEVLADETEPKLCKKTFIQRVRVKKPVTKFRNEEKKVWTTEKHDVTRKRYVPKQKERTIMVRMERLVKKFRDVVRKREVPQTRMVKKAILGDPKKVAQLHIQYKGCGCYKAQCGCVGQAGCGCCQPACACAPPIDQLARAIEYVEEPEEYTETIEYVDKEPYFETETYDSPRTEYYTIKEEEEYTVKEDKPVEQTITVRVPYQAEEIVYENRPTTITTDCDDKVPVEVDGHVPELEPEKAVVLADETDEKIRTINITRTRTCKDWKVAPDENNFGSPCTNPNGCCDDN